MFCLICAWIIRWVNNRAAGDLRRRRAHYDVIVMPSEINSLTFLSTRKPRAVILPDAAGVSLLNRFPPYGHFCHIFNMAKIWKWFHENNRHFFAKPKIALTRKLRNGALVTPLQNCSSIISQGCDIPDIKAHGANMGPTWVLSAQDGPHEPCYQGCSVVEWPCPCHRRQQTQTTRRDVVATPLRVRPNNALGWCWTTNLAELQIPL